MFVLKFLSGGVTRQSSPSLVNLHVHVFSIETDAKELATNCVPSRLSSFRKCEFLAGHTSPGSSFHATLSRDWPVVKRPPRHVPPPAINATFASVL